MRIEGNTPTPTENVPRPWPGNVIGHGVAWYPVNGLTMGEYARATSVLGDVAGYSSIDDARAAVAKLQPQQPPRDPHDYGSYPDAVAYLRNDGGTFNAFRLDKPMIEGYGSIFKKPSIRSVQSFTATNDRVAAIDNYFGPVPYAGFDDQTAQPR